MMINRIVLYKLLLELFRWVVGIALVAGSFYYGYVFRDHEEWWKSKFIGEAYATTGKLIAASPENPFTLSDLDRGLRVDDLTSASLVWHERYKVSILVSYDRKTSEPQLWHAMPLPKRW